MLVQQIGYTTMKEPSLKKHALIVSVVLAFCSQGCTEVADAVFQEKLEQAFQLEPNATVEIANVNGRIDVTAWDRTEASLMIFKRANEKADFEKVRIDIVAKPERLSIEARYPQSGLSWFRRNSALVDFELKVPRGVSLKRISSVNGSVRLQGVQGSVNASTVNGELAATGLAGDASLSTVNGSIEAEFEDFANVKTVNVETVNGSVSVTIPNNANATVTATTVNGRISAAEPLRSNIQKSRRGKLEGVLGNGTSKVNVSTVNGAVSINLTSSAFARP
ncbi:MAG: DUF4097 domain-containing protein [Verrucomicrobiae bacterium]|nr:DUF4097 domain-containing protein [Verrucomicrobiae bacterium]